MRARDPEDEDEDVVDFDRKSVVSDVFRFDREAVLGSLKKSALYGYQNADITYTSWPLLNDLKANNNCVLQRLRLN